jgi:putative ABC transport system substrate-binding protein
MRRRDVIAGLGGMAALPGIANAQSSPGPLRLGVVSATNSRSTSFWLAFVRRMRELGYVEGQNFFLDFVNLHGELDRYPEETVQMLRRGVDIIVAPGVELALKSAVAATKTLPVVIVAVDYDPLALGYVSNLASPGGNVTGVMFQQLEQTEKRLQLLRDAFPSLKAVTVLWDRISADQWSVAQQIAPKLGFGLAGIELGPPPNN